MTLNWFPSCIMVTNQRPPVRVALRPTGSIAAEVTRAAGNTKNSPTVTPAVLASSTAWRKGQRVPQVAPNMVLSQQDDAAGQKEAQDVSGGPCSLGPPSCPRWEGTRREGLPDVGCVCQPGDNVWQLGAA